MKWKWRIITRDSNGRIKSVDHFYGTSKMANNIVAETNRLNPSIHCEAYLD